MGLCDVTLSWCRLVAVFQSLSSRIRVIRGKRMDIPSAVCISDLENSAPVISQTGASYGETTKESIKQPIPEGLFLL